jgi:glycosyltransferase involved in cell wall biosynthesis
MPTMTFVVPTGIDDPARVSGGNVYDRHVRDGLANAGWDVRMAEVAPGADRDVRRALATVPDGGVALVDGLIAGVSASAIEDGARRVRVVILAHMVVDAFPDADPAAVDGQWRALRAAHRVIAVSEWASAQFAAGGIRDVVVAAPGGAPAEMATGTPGGGELLCVGVLAPHKGQDVLVDALARLAGVEGWRCTLAGATGVDPDFARALRERSRAGGVEARVEFAGVQAAAGLDRIYGRSDVLVAPSRTEAYGMAITEAQGRGIPVIASRTGGIPEAVDPAAAILVPPGDVDALAEALERWMSDPALRRTLKAGAVRARSRLRGWRNTVTRISSALGEEAP